MARIPWYLAALGAALLWGIHYPLIANALKKVSLYSVLLLTCLPIVLAAPWFHRTLATDIQALAALDWPQRATVLALAFTSLGASILLFLAIGGKNATLASLIEISYPFFVAVFAYLLFSETHVNVSTLVGGLLVFAGVGLIILSNP